MLSILTRSQPHVHVHVLDRQCMFDLWCNTVTRVRMGSPLWQVLPPVLLRRPSLVCLFTQGRHDRNMRNNGDRGCREPSYAPHVYLTDLTSWRQDTLGTACACDRTDMRVLSGQWAMPSMLRRTILTFGRVGRIVHLLWENKCTVAPSSSMPVCTAGTTLCALLVNLAVCLSCVSMFCTYDVCLSSVPV